MMKKTNKRNSNPGEESEHADSAMYQFCVYLRLLQLSGTHPLSQRETQSKNGGLSSKVCVKLFSPLFAYSAIVSTTSIYLLVLIILNTVFEIHWPEGIFDSSNKPYFQSVNGNSSGYIIIKFYTVTTSMFPIMRVVTIGNHALNLLVMRNHLNDLIEFYEDLQLYCRLRGRKFNIEMMVEETKMEIENGGRLVHLEEVQTWYRFLHRIRGFCHQIGDIRKFPQLLAILENITTLTVYLFTAIATLKSEVAHVQNKLFLAGAGYFGISLIRLYAKTSRAENVTEMEARLHQVLFTLNDHPQTLDVRIELKAMKRAISVSPTCIRLGNYVVYNQGIILTILTQVVTCLIVLLQF
ncbi:unnamed protein product [Allacma fusca]|uniref:Gustatory receptor n=1 Tax=Allacma fusca TaxID=39272 RepID=A0A8J2PKP0_9HEXA|nr:unnamed protein product [Allacma fusca]